MPCRAEVILFDCREDDAAVVRLASGAGGPLVRVVDSAVEVAHHAVARRPTAVFIGIGKRTVRNLDVIPVIRSARADVPIIVIAEEDALDLERRARKRSIFYYLIHPVSRAEVEAVLKDVLRHAQD